MSSSNSGESSDEIAAGDVLPDGFTITDTETARERLKSQVIGIIGLADDTGEAPELRPVNYSVYRSHVVMRTDRGQLFDAARHGKAATLAVTSFDEKKRTAWSVIVKGTLDIGSAESDGVKLATWAASDKAERIRLSIDEITGRHLLERKR